MASREDIVAEARRWVGTPFLHQARQRGIGCDCGGLIGGIAVELGIVPATWWRTDFDSLFEGYGRQPANGMLERICDSFMQRVERQPAFGDVVLMRFKREPQHLAVIGNYVHGGLSLIHALNGPRAVVEHAMSEAWANRVMAVYEMPGIEA